MNVNNDALDLNLVRVFLAIWDLRSLTAAGDRLGLTQPAISHALRRLRERLGDPLFVRAANRMLPTDVAVRLHEPLDEAFAIINSALQERAVFDPGATQRTFRVAMSDVAEVHSLPRLMAKLGRIAPSVRIEVVPLTADTVVSAMRSGEVDLAIGYIKNTERDCVSIDVFNDRLVCMVRAGHPIVRTGLTRSNFTSLRYFHARTSAPIHQMVEQWLADAGIRLQIAVRGHFTVAPEIVRSSDLAAIYPESLAFGHRHGKAFRLLDLPFELPPIEIKVHSHARFASDMGIKWLSEMTAEMIRAERKQFSSRST